MLLKRFIPGLLAFLACSMPKAQAQSVLGIPECQLGRPNREIAYVITTYTQIWNELSQRFPDKDMRVCYIRSFTVRGGPGNYEGWYTSYGAVNAVIEVSPFTARDAAEEVDRFVRSRHNVRTIIAPYSLGRHP